jgi:predicted small lipoprotein YifL
MKKILLFAVVIAAVATMTSCGAMGGVGAPSGSLYADVTYDGISTANGLGSKVGKASANAYLGLIALGDASIDAAAKAAGITKVSHVDHQMRNILGILVTYTTIVYGE